MISETTNLNTIFEQGKTHFCLTITSLKPFLTYSLDHWDFLTYSYPVTVINSGKISFASNS